MKQPKQPELVFRTLALKVYIQDPELGKGWYIVPAPHISDLDKTDAEIIAAAHKDHKDATAVRIARDYKVVG